MLRALPILICLLPAVAEGTWTKLKTAHFELYTTDGEKKGREAILHFEEVRSFFLQSSPSKKVPEFPVRIIAFRSEKEFAPYRINDFSAAFYTRDENRDYIVMRDVAPEHYPVAVHEFTHLIVSHSGLHLPVWMNEGWADLYSTLRPSGKKVVVGELLPGRVQTLAAGQWIPLAALDRVARDSPLYNERDQAGLFYAESWALMHMLYLGAGYSAHFSQVVVSIASGKSLAETCQKVLNKSLEEVQADLQQYLGNRLYSAVFSIRLTKSEEEPEVSEPAPLETGLMLADLLAVGRKPAAAKEAYEHLAAEHGNRPEIDESLGYLAWRSGNTSDARVHFQRAFDNGSHSAHMCYHLAALSENENKLDEALKALRKAVELKPDYLEARLHLATTLLAMGSYGNSLAELAKIEKVDEEHASAYFSASAYDYAHLGKEDLARQSAAQATKYAKTEEDIDRAAAIARFLAQPKSNPPPPNLFVEPVDIVSRLSGMLTEVECSGKGANVKLASGGKTSTFAIPDPERISLKLAGASKFDFTCGPQNPPLSMTVVYTKPARPEDGDGVVRALEF